MKEKKLFRLNILLEQVIDAEMMPAELAGFNNAELCMGIDQIIPTLDIFKEQLQRFIDTKLIPNTKKK